MTSVGRPEGGDGGRRAKRGGKEGTGDVMAPRTKRVREAPGRVVETGRQ